MNPCPNCAADVPTDQKFCGECGSRMLAVCSACGTGNPPDQRFCGECGTALADLAKASPTPARVASPTPVEAERRLVSVLFLDIAGFTPFTESRDAEEVREFVTQYFDEARDVIERFGGTVDKYIGDAVMALWGATKAEEDDAERAVRAGLELVDMVAKLGSEEGAPEMAARAGIMTGEASVGPGGNSTGLVLGDIVNTASRLQSIGDPGEVLVGQTTHVLTNRSILYSEVGERSLKGKEETVTVYRAERILAERGGVGRADIIEAPFVGRDEELRLLKDQLHATTREQRARLISIVGQAGIGKSRLVWEFEKYIDGLVETIYWHHGRAPSYSEGLAMWSIAEMIRARCRITETEDHDVARERLASTLVEFLEPEERDWVGPQLAAVLGLDQTSGERTEMHAAIRLFFERLAQRNTTVLIFEDLHWADAATLDFVEELTEWSRDHPILVVALARPDLLETRTEWGTLQRGMISMHLPPLADSDMRSLVAGLVPSMGPGPLASIVEPASGIPLFAVEMVRMLLNEGRLEPKDDGTFEPTGDISELAVPESIHAVIGARLDRLEADDRQVVQDAAVLGQTFTVNALAAISSLRDDVVTERLASLARREMFELIRDPRSSERGQYGFVQSLIREVAHGRIPREVRRERHKEVARYFESLETEEVAGVVASHWLDAVELGDTDSVEAAVSAVSTAVRRAEEVHASAQVVSLVSRTESIIDDGATMAPLWLAAADAAGAEGDPARGEEFARRLLGHAVESGDEAQRATALAALADVLNMSSQPVRALEILAETFDPDAQLPETEGHARLGAGFARAQLLTGTEGAHRTAGKALAVAERLELDAVAADALITRGTRLVDLRRPREGRALIAKAVEIAQERGFTTTYLRGLANSAYAAPTFEEGTQYGATGYHEARRVGDRRMIQFFGGQRSGRLTSRGDVDELLAMAHDPVFETADDTVRVHLESALANAYAARGDGESADRHWQTSAELMANVTDPQTLDNQVNRTAWRHVLAGDIAGAISLLDAQDNMTNPWSAIFASWAPLLMGGDPRLVGRFVELTEQLPWETALHPFRELGRFTEATIAGRAHGSSSAAIIDGMESTFATEAAVAAAIMASHLPAGPERADLAERSASITAAHGLDGVAALTERILAGEFKDV